MDVREMPTLPGGRPRAARGDVPGRPAPPVRRALLRTTALGAVLAATFAVLTASAVRGQGPPPPPPTDLGRRLTLTAGFDAPWMLVQTPGCGYPNWAGGVRHPKRQTCRLVVLLGNPGPDSVRLADRFPDLVDDRGATHYAVLLSGGPLPALGPGERVVTLTFSYGMPKGRRPVRLEGSVLAEGPRLRVTL
ncbi:hypothetical protein [Microbispora sp. ATCC PTA-5024]|uniref:hypothetical protein n=1 Tax=Microbispora sp. ATCC PTA-5024 TaxID=316330 RepID=UPI0003DC63FD|nr:hypothetical protein [Microbispora sp. ATCC PTA-5024]ETK30985.1 hypothetical protein MPTA5024_37360 [Microbispora sp. ATCC PTA-5024]